MAHVIYSCVAGRFEDITYGVLYFVLWGLDIVLFVVKLSIYFQATFSSWTFMWGMMEYFISQSQETSMSSHSSPF